MRQTKAEPHQHHCVLLILGRKILLQSTTGLEVITLCCLIYDTIYQMYLHVSSCRRGSGLHVVAAADDA